MAIRMTEWIDRWMDEKTVWGRNDKWPEEKTRASERDR